MKTPPPSLPDAPPATAQPETARKSAAVDPKAQERMRVIEAMGDQAVDENVEILKQLGLRALRALVLGGGGVVAFFIILRRKRAQELAAQEALSPPSEVEDAAARYLREMEEQGWDTDQHASKVAASSSNKTTP